MCSMLLDGILIGLNDRHVVEETYKNFYVNCSKKNNRLWGYSKKLYHIWASNHEVLDYQQQNLLYMTST